MQITLSFDNFTELPYTSGTIQNISSQATVEICQDDTANTGLILSPGEWFSWSNSTVYARSAWDYEPTARCAVVPFKEGGGSSDYGDYGDSVGHITWQLILQNNYLKLDGTPLANASNDYDELLKFAQDNSLITSDATDKSLFKYNSTNDVLTLPDYIGLVLQGGNTVEEKEAGLPNIEGSFETFSGGRRGIFYTSTINGVFEPLHVMSYAADTSEGGSVTTACSGIKMDVSASNPIYGNSQTVQPPAITLIPQIKYKKA